MKILVLRNYNMFAETGASANRWRTMVEGLSKMDVEFLLIITSGYRSREEKEKFGRRGMINNKIKYSYSSVQNRYDYWPARINYYLLSKWYIFISTLKIRTIVYKFRPKLVFICPDLEVFMIITKVFTRSHTDVKLMMETNEFNDIGNIHTTNILQKLIKKQYNHYLRYKIFPRLDVCLVMTETLIKHYSEFPGINPKITFLKVPMTVDLSRFTDVKLNSDLQRPYITYCGSSSFFTDGVDILIKSFGNVSRDYPDLKLYIAAFWEIDGERMMKLIHDTGMDGRIVYLGTLGRDEIPPLLMNARVLALPRPDSRQAKGGFPTKLGEYLASGNPVCVTRVGEIPDYLTDNESAFLADPGSINSFTEALIRALKDETNSKRVGENGRKVAEIQFNMDVQTKRIYDFLVQNL